MYLTKRTRWWFKLLGATLLYILGTAMLSGCGLLVPFCDDVDLACTRAADGTWRCPPPGGMVCSDGQVATGGASCVDHGGDYCRIRY